MDIRIGIVQSMKEIDVDLPDDGRSRQGDERGSKAALNLGIRCSGYRSQGVGSACRPSGSRTWKLGTPGQRARRGIRRGLTLRDWTTTCICGPTKSPRCGFDSIRSPRTATRPARHGVNELALTEQLAPICRRRFQSWGPFLGNATVTNRTSKTMAAYWDFHARNSLRGVRHAGSTGQGRGPSGEDRT